MLCETQRPSQESRAHLYSRPELNQFIVDYVPGTSSDRRLAEFSTLAEARAWLGEHTPFDPQSWRPLGERAAGGTTNRCTPYVHVSGCRCVHEVWDDGCAECWSVVP